MSVRYQNVCVLLDVLSIARLFFSALTFSFNQKIVLTVSYKTVSHLIHYLRVPRRVFTSFAYTQKKRDLFVCALPTNIFCVKPDYIKIET